MAELIIKMTSWLLAAMALGFIVAWLLSKVIYQKRHKVKEDGLLAIILERNNMVEKLEKNFRSEKLMSEKTSNNLKLLKKAYAQKTSELTILKNNLDNVNSTEDENLKLKEKYRSLVSDNAKLKDMDIRRVEELQGFEHVLMMAEDRVEKNEKHYSTRLRHLEENIEQLMTQNKEYEVHHKNNDKKMIELKEALKLCEADSTEDEFIISRDQFTKIEEQLEAYQDEISLLKKENSNLRLNRNRTAVLKDNGEQSLELKTIEALKQEEDDSSMLKTFKETYKKITNS
ncbi:MAG: Unknown protein [uncultured Sulfurovum sp.]|uniref:Uncharacterized protein n=1 Tax=uncultured Sulfurovum sp. TaxID=269237 RepID=A0A6S6T9W1_9BACT|nr:MAG: Unknown protein [uncultured Sulfurovum sp.]